jgi:hypothetical protein
MANNLCLQKQYYSDSIKEKHTCVYSYYTKEYEKCVICGNLKKKNDDKPE